VGEMGGWSGGGGEGGRGGGGGVNKRCERCKYSKEGKRDITVRVLDEVQGPTHVHESVSLTNSGMPIPAVGSHLNSSTVVRLNCPLWHGVPLSYTTRGTWRCWGIDVHRVNWLVEKKWVS
jgi:hypothetical protein